MLIKRRSARAPRNTALAFAAASCAAACSLHDVSSQSAKAVSTATQPTKLKASDKLDLLFAVDDSASMADKHELLRQVIPSLISRLTTPLCIDEQGTQVGRSDAFGRCAQGTLEFAQVRDLHVGVLSSSLGTAGDICTPELNRHAELYLPGRLKQSAAPFLSWQSQGQQSAPEGIVFDEPSELAGTLQTFFSQPTPAQPVTADAIGERGCGIESQMESVYQFLIAPDPYDHYSTDGTGSSIRQGIRDSVLSQRKAFLRPDSMVLVVMLSDENDASIDSDSLGQGGTRFSSWDFGRVGQAGPESSSMRTSPYSGINTARGWTFPGPTAACGHLKNASAAQLAACTSCVLAPQDPACASPFLAEQNDALPTRFARMRERYGLDPLFPVSRYTRGFRSQLVPDRGEEHGPGGIYLARAGHCTNPLFASALPSSSAEELCHLPAGPRSEDLVYFAMIGGVPHDLVASQQHGQALGHEAWTRILGTDRDSFNEDGIDPRMVELGTPRTREALMARGILAEPAGIDELRASMNASKRPSDADYIVADSDTNTARGRGGFGSDLNYACTFPIDARDVTREEAAGAHVCNVHYGNEICSPAAAGASTTRKQVRAKAYPTLRELELARTLGEQGIAASICPTKLSSLSPDSDADYGYNPAIGAILARVGKRLGRP